MKKLLTICLLAYFTQAVAQNKSASIDGLIKNNTFTFVVNEVKKKPGFNGTFSHQSNTAMAYNINPSVMTPLQSQNINSKPLGSTGIHVQQEYNRLSQLDGSYFTAYQLNNKSNNSSSTSETYAIFLMQEKDQISLNKAQQPATVSQIKKSDFNIIPVSNYDLKSAKKNNGKWTLTYRVKNGDQANTFYLDVNQDGSAVLTQQPTKEATILLNGFIIAPKQSDL